MSCTSRLAVTIVDSVFAPARRSPRLAARLSSRAEYRAVCAFDDHREFLRITEVTERISEHNMCLFETESSTAVPIVIGDVISVELRVERNSGGRRGSDTTRHDFARIHCHVRAFDTFLQARET